MHWEWLKEYIDAEEVVAASSPSTYELMENVILHTLCPANKTSIVFWELLQGVHSVVVINN